MRLLDRLFWFLLGVALGAVEPRVAIMAVAVWMFRATLLICKAGG